MFHLPVTMPKTLNYLIFEDSNFVTALSSTQLSVDATYVPAFPSFEYSSSVIFKLLTVNLLLLIAKRKNIQPTKTPPTKKNQHRKSRSALWFAVGFFPDG